jgi:hypothetical protein
MRNEIVLWHARTAASLFAVVLATCATVARADDGTPAAPPVPAAPTQAVAAPQLTVPDSPIVVFQLASSAADVVAAQEVTALASERLRYMYGDQVKVVSDMGSETMQQIVQRLGAGIYIGGSIEKINGQYYADFQSRDGITNAIVGEQRFAFQDLSALPKDTALVSLVETGPMIPNAHYVLVPLIDDTQVAQENQSAYLTWTQNDLVKHLAAHGITATVVSAMDPVDARIGAADLCRDNNATGVIVGHTWHRQDYQQGALKSGMKGFEKALEIVPLAGPIAAGLVNAAGNGAIGVAGSDDKYPAHAEVDLTLLNCDGKRVWSGAGQGDTAHFSGHNVAAGQIGAIDLAVITISDTIATRR